MSYLLKSGKLGSADEKIEELSKMVYYFQAALEVIATPKRPDGTFNRDRESCQELAETVLNKFS